MVDAFCADSPAAHERLLSALLSPAVSELLWRPGCTLRADSWPARLQPILERAAACRGFTVTPVSANAHLFVREASEGRTELTEERWVSTDGADRGEVGAGGRS